MTLGEYVIKHNIAMKVRKERKAMNKKRVITIATVATIATVVAGATTTLILRSKKRRV